VEPFSLTEAVLRDVDDAVNFREFETCSAATLFENFGLKAIDPEATERSMTRENLRSFIFLTVEKERGKKAMMSLLRWRSACQRVHSHNVDSHCHCRTMTISTRVLVSKSLHFSIALINTLILWESHQLSRALDTDKMNLHGDTSYILVRTTGCLWVSKEKILTQAEYGVSDNRN
jgi:hypothetical protein